jgi:hypothetical protein
MLQVSFGMGEISAMMCSQSTMVRVGLRLSWPKEQNETQKLTKQPITACSIGSA